MLEQIPQLTYVATAFLTATMQGATEVSTVRRFKVLFLYMSLGIHTSCHITGCVLDVDSETILT